MKFDTRDRCNLRPTSRRRACSRKYAKKSSSGAIEGTEVGCVEMSKFLRPRSCSSRCAVSRFIDLRGGYLVQIFMVEIYKVNRPVPNVIRIWTYLFSLSQGEYRSPEKISFTFCLFIVWISSQTGGEIQIRLHTGMSFAT